MKTQLILGDCIDKLKELEDNSVDSIVTDPPYGLEFMGKAWDSFKTGRISKYKEGGSIDLEQIESRKGKGGAGPSYTKRAAKRCRTCGKQEWSGSPCKCETPDFEIDNSTQHTFQSFSEAWATECYRVLKPGGHLLAFGGSRMYHRLAVGVEDAGFEIRDQIMWVYGSGFPKSHNIALAIDKAEGATGHRGKAINIKGAGNRKDLQGKEAQNQNSEFYHKPYNEPISENGKDWNGWGTALKPAHEPIVMARKPLIGTVADNVLEYGVGGINIDGCRIATDDKLRKLDGTFTFGAGQGADMKGKKNAFVDSGLGRFPANIIFDEEAGKILDEQSGTTKSSKRGEHNNKKTEHTNTYTPPNAMYSSNNTHGDTGGASRFFYCPKSSKRDRNEGCDGLPQKANVFMSPDSRMDKDQYERTSPGMERFKTEPKSNFHPTVKPTELMKYLIRLVTPKGGVVLDPFMGSGSTGKAAVLEGMEFIGIEREREYFEIAEQRIGHVNKPKKYTEFFG